MDLTITTTAPTHEVRVVNVEGEVDIYTSTQLKQEITDILASGTKFVLLDLSKVEYLDSTGLGLLIGALKRLREIDGNLIIVNPSQRIVRVFEITGLYKIFKVYPSLAEASEKENLSL